VAKELVQEVASTQASAAGVALAEEPTLPAELRRFAAEQLPGRFHQFLQLGVPAAVQFWVWGLPRTAGWSAVLSLFGIWALCEQTLDRRAEVARLEGRPEPGGRLLRAIRAVAGGIAGLGASALVVEGVVRVLGVVFRCPGCAG
jgi:hypothetical protein